MSLLTAGQQFEQWKARAEDVSQIFPTGIKAWDRLLRRGGMHRQELFGLAARDGVGKTMLACVVISNLVRAGHPVLFLSSEMSSEDITNRLIAIHYGLPVSDIEDQALFGQLPPWLEERYRQDFEPYLVIDDQSSPTLRHIREAVDEANIHIGHKPAVVVQDHLEMVSQEGVYGSTADKLARNTQELKNIARDLDVVFLVLLQNNKGSDDSAGLNHGHRRVTKEDVFGGVSRHLGIIFTAYRPGLDPNLDEHEKVLYRNTVQLGIAKNRFGPMNVDGEPYEVDWKTLQLMEVGAGIKEAA